MTYYDLAKTPTDDPGEKAARARLNSLIDRSPERSCFTEPDLDPLEYKGFKSSTIVDWRTRIIFGQAIKPDCRGVITFQGENMDNAAKAFCDSVEDYLEWENEQPD